MRGPSRIGNAGRTLFVALGLAAGSCRGARSEAPPAAVATAAPAARGVGAPPHLALLIGIDEYAGAEGAEALPVLLGAKSDVERVRRLLIDRFGFADDEIRVLFDRRATHEAIVTTFHDWLIERAGPQTEVLVWYSGHGSRCPDAHPELNLEPHGLDSTLVAYDSRAPGHRGGFDVTDDEVDSLLRVLCAKTSRVTVVTDSCHSGGATRGVPVPGERVRHAADVTKPLDWKDVEPFWPKDVPFLDDDAPKRSRPASYVHLAACSPDEVAREVEMVLPDGTSRDEGAFSHFLIEALERGEPGATYGQVVRDAGVRLSTLFRDQHPEVEGDADRKLFSGEFAPPPPGFAAAVKPASGDVAVEAGALHLLRVGSKLEVRDASGRVLGAAVVRHVEPVTSVAAWIGKPPEIAEAAAVRAIEVERPRGPTPLRLRCADDPAVQSVSNRLTASTKPSLELVRGAAGGRGLALRVGKVGGLELIEEPDGIPLWPTHAEGASRDSEPTLADVLADEQRHRDLLALAEQPGTIPVAVEMVECRGSELDAARNQRTARLVSRAPRGAHAGPSTSAAQRVEVGPGVENVVKLRVTIDASRRKTPAYVSILCVSEDRSVDILYPTGGSRENLVTPGAPLESLIQVFVTEIDGLARPAVDRVLVLATEVSPDLSSYRHGSRLLPAAQIQPTRGDDGLPDVLQEAFAPTLTRGAAAIAVLHQEFGVASLDFEVVTSPAPPRTEGSK